MAKLFKKDSAVLVLLIILFSLYAAIFIYRTSFVIGGERYFSLFDDAMVSMHYARNFVEGRGLVFNAAEYAEGYTNFLWVLNLVLLWRFLLIRPEPQVSSGLYVEGITERLGA